MKFELSEEHRAIQELARDFAQNTIVPIAPHFDEIGEFPLETIRQMGKLGLMGIEVPEEYGGAGMDTLAYVLALEEICKADASHGTIMSVNNSLFCHGLMKCDSHPRLAKGRAATTRVATTKAETSNTVETIDSLRHKVPAASRSPAPCIEDTTE